MRLFKRGKYWWADLRSYGLGRKSTGKPTKKEANTVVLAFLAKEGFSPESERYIPLHKLIADYLDHSKSTKEPTIYLRDQGVLGSIPRRLILFFPLFTALNVFLFSACGLLLKYNNPLFCMYFFYNNHIKATSQSHGI